MGTDQAGALVAGLGVLVGAAACGMALATPVGAV